MKRVKEPLCLRIARTLCARIIGCAVPNSRVIRRIIKKQRFVLVRVEGDGVVLPTVRAYTYANGTQEGREMGAVIPMSENRRRGQCRWDSEAEQQAPFRTV